MVGANVGFVEGEFVGVFVGDIDGVWVGLLVVIDGAIVG